MLGAGTPPPHYEGQTFGHVERVMQWCPSIRKVLLRTLIEIRTHGKTAPVLSTALKMVSLDHFLYKLCLGIEKLNSLARDGLALLGTSDGSALTDFLYEFFAGV